MLENLRTLDLPFIHQGDIPFDVLNVSDPFTVVLDTIGEAERKPLLVKRRAQAEAFLAEKIQFKFYSQQKSRQLW